MKNRILKFSVCNQHISSDDICVVADSKNYLMALFNFDPTWEGVIKTAVFSNGDNVYNMLLTDDMCRVPTEVVCGDGFFVSVFGGDLITADKVKVSVTPSGLKEGIAPPEPTPSVYDQMLTLVAAEVAVAEGSADEAEQHAKTAESFAAAAKADKEALLTGGTRWVFDGGGATGNAIFSLVVDETMSDTSINPVQNKVIKEFAEKTATDAKEEAVTESNALFAQNLNEIAADYIVEQGQDPETGWTYWKYKSGNWEGRYRYTVDESITLSKNFDDFYYTEAIQVMFPSWCSYISIVNVDGGPNDHLVFPRAFNVTKEKMSFIFIGLKQITVKPGVVYIYANGKWKEQ